MKKEAALYNILEDNAVQCYLCAHRCRIADGKRGICLVRENQGGKLYSLVYGRAVSQAIDPVEKKPLFHFYPGSLTYSVATVGCNFRCDFCQNWEISQAPREGREFRDRETPPEMIVAGARHYNCRCIAYTYTEPTVFFEYTYDTSVLAHAAGIANIYVTNGYMTAEMLEAYKPYLDAANVDLKSFRDETYRRVCKARLQPVLDALKCMKQQGVWVEVTTLLVPDMNDSEAELRALADFLVNELGPETPWHISRFHPDYKMLDRSATPLSTLHRARDIGREAGLRYVYEGNVPWAEGENTFCYHCGRLLIRRYGFSVTENVIKEGRCPYCSTVIDGVGL